MSRPRILLVEDDAAFAEVVRAGLSARDFDVHACVQPAAAFEALERLAPEAVVTDLRIPGSSGLEVLERSRELDPSRPVLVITAFGAVDTAIECVRRGAFHYLTKPFKLDDLALFLRRALASVELDKEARALRRQLLDEIGFGRIVAASPGVRDTCELLARVADAPVPVLLTGETGTGKSVLARALHDTSARRRGPFVTVACAALPEPLLESELFGHLRGAFSGATQTREGLVAAADGGTLFLDEIGEMPLSMQARLLDVLERSVVRPVGSSREQSVDVRVVAATHRDLRALVDAGTFREDLFYRLCGVVVEVPPLRERRDDVPRLALHFLERLRSQHPRVVARSFAPDAMRRLVESSWPGNVRELRLTVERTAFLARGEAIEASDLPPSLASAPVPVDGARRDQVLPLREVQRRYARWALDRLGGRKMLACEALDIDPKTLNRLLADE